MPRTDLDRLLGPSTFLWLTGIEDTFITAPSARTGRTLDEYELTQHYARWRADLALMQALGVSAVRYGIPWHRINPSPGTWRWECADGPLERLLELGIDPVVDLVHYGVPPWIDGAFLHPDFDRLMAELAARTADRFRGRIRWYTPLNEPRITAWYCGKLGWWPPGLRGWRGFVRVLLAVCRGIVAATRALRAVDDDLVALHVDATDLYETDDPDLRAEAARRQEIVFLALDLVSGGVGASHPLRGWLLTYGAREAELEWFAENSIMLDLIGINAYPLFSQKRLGRTPRGLRIRMPYAGADILERLARMYWERYRRPLIVTETASEGSVARRRAWLDDSVAAVRRAREQGVPIVGYTWWPMFALVTWAYREGRKDPARYLKQMGLWDLRASEDGALDRVATPLVDRYRELATGGTREVGALAAPETMEEADVP